MHGLVYIFTLMAFAHGVDVDSTDPKVNLSSTSIFAISSFSDNGPTIDWLPVEDTGEEPVLGYKFKMWEVGCVTKRRFKTVNGETVSVKERVMPRLRDYSTLRNLKVYTVEGLNNTSILLEDLPVDVPYHVMVAAYSKSGEGPPSPPFRFQLEGRYKCREY